MKRTIKQKQISLFECLQKAKKPRDDLISDVTRLADKAKLRNYNIIPTVPDGNCLFSAVAQQVGLPCSRCLRHDTVDYLKAHPELGEFVETNITYDQYIAKMSNDHTWGDGLILEAMVKMLKRPIFVLQSDDTEIMLTAPTIPQNVKPITLGFVALTGSGPRNHYVSLKENEPSICAATTTDTTDNISSTVTECYPPVIMSQLSENVDSEINSIPIIPTTNSSSPSTLTHQQSSAVPHSVLNTGVTGQCCSQTNADIDLQSTVSLDIGDFVQKSPETVDLKLKLLQNCWLPPDNYDFKFDANGKRVFRRVWLSQYAPWLAYSHSLKGPVCRYCVLFPQKVHRGMQGAFILKPFVKFKDFHDSAKNHAQSVWHKASQEDSSNFLRTASGKSLPICQQIDTQQAKVIEGNRAKLYPIVSCILFCGTHDIALRGKTADSGNIHDLIDFRIDAGDSILKEHITTAPGNAKYTSNRVHNELIEMCATTVRDDIVRDANASDGFSILADETTDISGAEQLSIGVRFLGYKSGIACVRDEFIGFVTLVDRTAEGIASVILTSCSNFGLNLDKLVGQGYDGCSAMAGIYGGVQAIIRQKYPRAVFIHCSSHRLNLVVNDLNALCEVRNVIGTIKTIINFFRDSAARRRLIPNVPLLCETRWTHKYRSIRIFAENFVEIVMQLESLSRSAVKKTRETAYQLLCAARSPSFIVVLQVVKKYSSLLEPVTQALQAVQLDLLGVQNHVTEMLTVIRKHRQDCDDEFDRVYKESEAVADKLGTQLLAPRQVAKQMNRANPPNNNAEEYYRRAVFIPYLDSLISSLETRFSDANKDVFSLFELHPRRMSKCSKMQFDKNVKRIHELYGIDNFVEEAGLWHDVWASRTPLQPVESDWELPFIELLDHITLFPAISQAIRIAMALPATTCSIERSFSTLRRVKTWLRSTMTDDRLSGLCMLSVHRDMICGNKAFIDRVINMFGQNPRRLGLLFK